MRVGTKFAIIFCSVLLGIGILFSLPYNSLVTEQESVRQSWSQVENVYQRRADLIPNLVAVVKGYASHEQQTLIAVTEARAKVSGTGNINPTADPDKFKQFQQSQSDLSQALSRLMVVVEKYPDLKANQNFLQLQIQLEGTENRITVERQRYNETAQIFNAHIRLFPAVMIARLGGFNAVEYFKADPAAKTAPKVSF